MLKEEENSFNDSSKDMQNPLLSPKIQHISCYGGDPNQDLSLTQNLHPSFYKNTSFEPIEKDTNIIFQSTSFISKYFVKNQPNDLSPTSVLQFQVQKEIRNPAINNTLKHDKDSQKKVEKRNNQNCSFQFFKQFNLQKNDNFNQKKYFNLNQSFENIKKKDNQQHNKDFTFSFRNCQAGMADNTTNEINYEKSKQISKMMERQQILQEIYNQQNYEQNLGKAQLQQYKEKQQPTSKQFNLIKQNQAQLPKNKTQISSSNAMINFSNSFHIQFGSFEMVDQFLEQQNTQQDYLQYQNYLKRHLVLEIHPTPKTYTGKCLLSNGKFLLSYIKLLTRGQKNAFLIKYMLTALEQVFKIQSNFQEFKSYKEQYLPSKKIMENKISQLNDEIIKQPKNIELKFIKVYLKDKGTQTDIFPIPVNKGIKRIEQKIQLIKIIKQKLNKMQKQSLLSQEYMPQEQILQNKKIEDSNCKKKKIEGKLKQNFLRQLETTPQPKQSKLKKSQNKQKSKKYDKSQSNNQSITSIQAQSQSQQICLRIKTRSKNKVQKRQKSIQADKEKKNVVKLRKKK